jgi:hypothetical protein
MSLASFNKLVKILQDGITFDVIQSMNSMRGEAAPIYPELVLASPLLLPSILVHVALPACPASEDEAEAVEVGWKKYFSSGKVPPRKLEQKMWP